jgi:hypothetical protein
VTKRVKSAHGAVEPELPENAEKDLFCHGYLLEVIGTMESEKQTGCVERNWFEAKENPKRFISDRKVVLNWLLPVAHKYTRNRAVIFKATQLMDLYFAKAEVPSSKMQLAASVALIMASKYHDRYPISFDRMISESANAFTEPEIIQMEMEMLEVIGFTLTNPLTHDFIQWFLLNFSTEKHQKELKQVSYYLAECLLLQEEFIGASCKEIASVAVYWSLQMVSRTKWGPKFDQLFPIDEEGMQAHAKIILHAALPTFKMNGIQEEYFKRYKVMKKIFRNPPLKGWLKRRSERHARRTKSLMLQGK